MKKLILIYSLASCSIIAQYPQWETFGKMINPVAGGQALVVDNKVYILGGYSDEVQKNVDWIQEFNVDTRQWKIIGKMSVPRFGFLAGKYGEEIIILGGVQDTVDNAVNMESFPFGYDYTKSVFADTNFNRIFAAGQILNDIFYIFGGNAFQFSESKNLPYLSAIDLENDSIAFSVDSLFLGSELPSQQMSAAFNDNVYLFGGVINGVSKRTYCFNSTDTSFSRVPIDLISPRAAGCAVPFAGNDVIYIIGGYNESNQALKSSEIIHIFGDNYFIEEAQNLVNSRKNLMAVEYKSDILVFGGFDELGRVVPHIERLALSTATTTAENRFRAVNFSLEQNYPNPFNPTTVIKFQVPSSKFVKLKVYDLLGREIQTLIDAPMPSGEHEIRFDGSNLASGVYIYRLTAGGYVYNRKMILAK